MKLYYIEETRRFFVRAASEEEAQDCRANGEPAELTVTLIDSAGAYEAALNESGWSDSSCTYGVEDLELREAAHESIVEVARERLTGKPLALGDLVTVASGDGGRRGSVVVSVLHGHDGKYVCQAPSGDLHVLPRAEITYMSPGFKPGCLVHTKYFGGGKVVRCSENVALVRWMQDSREEWIPYTDLVLGE